MKWRSALGVCDVYEEHVAAWQSLIPNTKSLDHWSPPPFG
jgi:hypothetical protein